MCLVALGSLAVGSHAEWKPADGVVDLNALEQALRSVEMASMSPEQKKVSAHVVADVEKVVVQLNSDKKLTKAQKMDKAKGAIQELQGLQSQWELAAVEKSLKTLTDLPHLSPEQRAAAKKVVAVVDATVEDVEAGKLTGAARNKQVGLAITELQGLQRDWLNVTTVSKVEALEKAIAAKKAQLKEAEAELKLVHMEKELAEKKMLLKKLQAQKGQSEEMSKQKKEDATQEEMVSKLLGMAKALAASKKPLEAHASVLQPNASALAANPALNELTAQLKAQEHNISASIERLDVEAKAQEAALSRSIEEGSKMPAKLATKAMSQSEKMMKTLLKDEHRKYLKTRALKESQRKELQDGIKSIQQGDTTALAKLILKMETEGKSLQAKTKGFLY